MSRAVIDPQAPYLVNRDPADETRLSDGGDFELDEIARLQKQLDAARAAFTEAYAKMPVFVQNWLKPLGRVLGVLE